MMHHRRRRSFVLDFLLAIFGLLFILALFLGILYSQLPAVPLGSTWRRSRFDGRLLA